MLQQGKLVSGLPVGGIEEAGVAAQISDSAVAQLPEVVGGLPPGGQIVVVDADCLDGQLVRLAHHHIEQPRLAEIVHDLVLGLCVQKDHALQQSALVQILQRPQNLALILPGDYGGGVLPLVAKLADSPERLQIKGILISCAGRGGQDDPNLPRLLTGAPAGGGRGLVVELRHRSAHLLPGIPADGRIVVAHAGNGGGGYARQCRDVLDGNCHGCAPFLKTKRLFAYGLSIIEQRGPVCQLPAAALPGNQFWYDTDFGMNEYPCRGGCCPPAPQGLPRISARERVKYPPLYSVCVFTADSAENEFL